MLRSIWATTIFEINRSLSLQRILVSAVLAGFPPAMVAVIGFSGKKIPVTDFLIISLVAIVGLLSLLLWATSNVYSELEGKSWIFLASRPRGRVSLFIGKYLSAVGFSYIVCFVSISICLALQTYMLDSLVNPFLTWIGMLNSSLFACLIYSAVFSVIGTIFQKRAMVFGAGYLILSEMILANVPGIISRFTPRFHLQAIAAEWIGWFYPIPQEDFIEIFGESTLAFHVICLVSAILGLLTIGCVIIKTRQYVSAEEV